LVHNRVSRVLVSLANARIFLSRGIYA